MGETGDRGSATVEFAMLLPAVVMILATLLGSVQWATAQIRVESAAATAARVAIVGTDIESRAAVTQAAGSGVLVSIVRDGAWIRVTVTAATTWGLPVRGTAVALAQE